MNEEHTVPLPNGGNFNPKRLAKMRDAAEEYGLDYRYMRRLVDERRIASVKFGKYRLVDLDSLDRLLAESYEPAVPPVEGLDRTRLRWRGQEKPWEPTRGVGSSLQVPAEKGAVVIWNQDSAVAVNS